MNFERGKLDEARANELITAIGIANATGNNTLCPTAIVWGMRLSTCKSFGGLVLKHTKSAETGACFLVVRCNKATANAVMDGLVDMRMSLVIPDERY